MKVFEGMWGAPGAVADAGAAAGELMNVPR